MFSKIHCSAHCTMTSLEKKKNILHILRVCKAIVSVNGLSKFVKKSLFNVKQ